MRTEAGQKWPASRWIWRLLIGLIGFAGMLNTSHAAERGITPRSSYVPYPAWSGGYVTDEANVFTATAKDSLEEQLWNIERQTGVEMAVLTLHSWKDYPQVPAVSIEDFGKKAIEFYGIGTAKANNGILLLVCVKDRQARIALGSKYGRGRDADAKAIMEKEILPYFRQGEYSAGIFQGVHKMDAGLIRSTHIPYRFQFYISRQAIIDVGLILLVPLVVFAAVSLYREGKLGWGWVILGCFIILLLVVLQILKVILNFGMTRSNGWEGSSRHFGSYTRGGGGGNSGSFGGGSRGGGGATGSW